MIFSRTLLKRHSVLPGFGLALGFAVVYVSLLVLVPLSAAFLKTATMTWPAFWDAVSSPRVLASYRLTFGASFAGALVNAVFGLIVAWVLVRYEFPLKRLLDALVDLPLALPTAVAGLVYSSLYVPSGWMGRFLCPLGIEGAYSRLGIVLVLTFTGFPFVVRAVQPVLEGLEGEVEEAAALLGATRLQAFRRVILPALQPALLTGFTLALARALGEYGSVVFVSGNMPFRTEIAPVLIVARLEEFAYGEATALAVELLAVSLTMLVVINRLERWSRRHDA